MNITPHESSLTFLKASTAKMGTESTQISWHDQNLCIAHPPDESLNQLVKLFSTLQLKIYTCTNLLEFELVLKASPPDLIITSRTLSGTDILDWAESRKENFLYQIPTIVLSGPTPIQNVIRYLEHGVVYFLMAPVEEVELQAKVIYQLEQQTIKKLSTNVLRQLTLTERLLFLRLISQPQRFHGRAALEQSAWDSGIVVGLKTLNVHLNNLKRKLNPFGWDLASDRKRGWKITQIRN